MPSSGSKTFNKLATGLSSLEQMCIRNKLHPNVKQVVRDADDSTRYAVQVAKDALKAKKAAKFAMTDMRFYKRIRDKKVHEFRNFQEGIQRYQRRGPEPSIPPPVIVALDRDEDTAPASSNIGPVVEVKKRRVP